MKDETVWLNREHLSILFDRDVKTILIMLWKKNLMVQLSQNLRQLQKMEKAVKLIDIANRANENLEIADAKKF